MQETRLSVALVTRNRPSSLERTLKSLRAQGVQPWEVVISDDSDLESAAEVSRLANVYHCRYLIGPRRGLYANRNHVALACGGTHIRSMDDDHEFPADHMARCLAAIKQDPEAVWIIGEFLPHEFKPDVPPECPGQLHPRGFSMAPPEPDSSWALADGATIYPRQIFDTGIRFADNFKFGAAYLEFGSRLHFLGYRIRHLQSTYVVHYYEAANRSVADPEGELAAEIFAMLCHSFVYQPNFRNKLLSIAQITLMLVRSGRRAWRALQKALVEFKKRRDSDAAVNGV
jgi:glycosyltransferase involved in cell wall biosynthesis